MWSRSLMAMFPKSQSNQTVSFPLNPALTSSPPHLSLTGTRRSWIFLGLWNTNRAPSPSQTAPVPLVFLSTLLPRRALMMESLHQGKRRTVRRTETRMTMTMSSQSSPRAESSMWPTDRGGTAEADRRDEGLQVEQQMLLRWTVAEKRATRRYCQLFISDTPVSMSLSLGMFQITGFI